jgi:cyclohexadieny/prephenate dehydrogenase
LAAVSDATRVAIVGLGAIGGSAALKLVERGIIPKGFTADGDDRRLAAAAGVRVADSIEAAVRDVDLVLLAVPLDALADVARQVTAAAPNTATILHATSLQRPSATGLTESVLARVIGTHPLAGTSRGGFAAAAAGMFHDATVYVEPRGTRRNREDAELFWSMAGATRIEYLDADDHDDRMAAVSHLPQLLSTAFAAMLATSGTEAGWLGPGGRDMTRLAMSPWTMWAPLLSAAPDRTSGLLESFADELAKMRQALEAGDISDLEATWSKARSWREAVDR